MPVAARSARLVVGPAGAGGVAGTVRSGGEPSAPDTTATLARTTSRITRCARRIAPQSNRGHEELDDLLQLQRELLQERDDVATASSIVSTTVCTTSPTVWIATSIPSATLIAILTQVDPG